MTVYITEFSGLAPQYPPREDRSGRELPQAPFAPAIAHQTVTPGGDPSAAFNAETTLIRIATDADVIVDIAATPNAAESAFFMPGGSAEYQAVGLASGLSLNAVAP